MPDRHSDTHEHDPNALATGGAERRAREQRFDILALIIVLLLALAPLAAHLTGQNYLVSLIARAMIFALAALALDLVLGFAGLVSFGHAAIVGLGAYVAGVLMRDVSSDALIIIPCAMLVSALFAFVTGALALRTRGVAFIMITLAFGQMLYFVAQSLSIYGGDDGLTIYARMSIGGWRPLKAETAFYALALASLIITYLVARFVTRSPLGRAATAARDNPERMAALGYNVTKLRLALYALSGALAGLAGVLLANQAEFVSPAYLSWQRSGELIVMVVIGGMGTLIGPVIGALALFGAEEWLSHLTPHWKAILGPLVVLVALYARSGLAGLITGWRARR
jgi:branched-chain amino acid transport system permease protein